MHKKCVTELEAPVRISAVHRTAENCELLQSRPSPTAPLCKRDLVFSPKQLLKDFCFCYLEKIGRSIPFLLDYLCFQIIYFYLSCVPKAQHSKILERFSSMMPENLGLALR